MSRQTTVHSMLLSVAAGQPSDSIAMVCSNESTFLAKSTIAYCMLSIGFHSFTGLTDYIYGVTRGTFQSPTPERLNRRKVL